jgi:hypothetical protein
MSEKIAKLLFPINCSNNFKIEADGRCYSDSCMMNADPELKEKIARQGCKAFNMAEVQVLETHKNKQTGKK